MSLLIALYMIGVLGILIGGIVYEEEVSDFVSRFASVQEEGDEAIAFSVFAFCWPAFFVVIFATIFFSLIARAFR